MRKISAFFILLLLPFIAFASVPKWQIIPERSSLSFEATQNDAPVIGRFKNFSGEILFDPTKLAESQVTITVDMTSIDTDYEDLTNTLKSEEWFNVEKFPTAVFKSTKFSKLSDSQYQAEGHLIIRDKSVPVTLHFELKKFTDQEAIIEGNVDVKRLAFDIGTGEWKSVKEVKDEVKIKFNVAAKK